MVYVHPVVAFVAEPLGELEELFRHPAWDIGEDQIGNDVVCPSQSRG
jgi:hypothetical protein